MASSIEDWVYYILLKEKCKEGNYCYGGILTKPAVTKCLSKEKAFPILYLFIMAKLMESV